MGFLLILGPTGRRRVGRQMGSEKGHNVAFLAGWGEPRGCGTPVEGVQRREGLLKNLPTPHRCRQKAPGDGRRRVCTRGPAGAESPESCSPSNPRLAARVGGPGLGPPAGVAG